MRLELSKSVLRSSGRSIDKIMDYYHGHVNTIKNILEDEHEAMADNDITCRKDADGYPANHIETERSITINLEGYSHSHFEFRIELYVFTNADLNSEAGWYLGGDYLSNREAEAKCRTLIGEVHYIYSGCEAVKKVNTLKSLSQVRKNPVYKEFIKRVKQNQKE